MKDLNQLSEALLLQVKMQKDTTQFETTLAEYPIDDLISGLETDSKKNAFWINIYNAYFQILRKVKKVDKKNIYKSKKIDIAGTRFNLDNIEHGILRRYRYKYSLGLFPNLLTPKLIKKLAVNKIDYRIHFALNCGAKSCPPIAFYNHKKLDQQLDLATQVFLEDESEYDDEKKVLRTTALFQWFKFDFGGQKGIREIYKSQLNKDLSGYSINYKEYSWDEQLDNFVEG